MGCFGRSRSRRRTFRRPTMPSFKKPQHSLSVFRRLVDTTTLFSPTDGGFHRDVNGRGPTLTGLNRKLPPLMPAVKKQLERIFSELCGIRLGRSSQQLSREKFEAFLKTTQGGLVAPLELEKYTFEQFLEVWYSHYRNAVRPIECEKKDLSKPISNYFISSSHNTYALGNQLYGQNSAEAYRKVLRADCRCIEIDVWNGDSSGSRTPNRSKSPHDHKRHLSSSSLPAAAAAVIESVDEKWHKISGRPNHHNRSPDSSQVKLSTPARDSGTCLDPNAINERLGRPRTASGSGSGSRGRSRSKSKHRSRKHEPIVTHATKVPGAGTVALMNSVPFREVCQAIRETAFVTNHLPIIVSLEVHADPDQQEVMVEIMKEEWAGLLLDEPFDACDPKTRQPRLDELLDKILIKVKKAHAKASVPRQGTQLSLPTISSLEEDASGSEDERLPEAKSRKVPICESLGNLAIYTHSEHFKRFDTMSAKTPSHIFSISETKILELHQSKHKEMFTHNRDFFMRAYPHSFRVDSSNLDPSLFWRKGVQMVALNWQKWDEGMMLNNAMFDCEKGWVLKPSGYLSSDTSTSQAEAHPHRTLNLRITVLAGQHIPIPESSTNGSTKSLNVSGVSGADFRPYVKCELHVEKHEERAGEAIEGGGRAREGQYKQKTKSRETDNPDFGKGMVLDFSGIPKVVEELSFVRLKIEDESKFLPVGELAAWACIRLDRLQPGYRFINLLDAKGNPSDGKLLVKIEKSVR